MRIISNLYDFTDSTKWDGKYEVIECRKALSPSKLPGIDYALNPYGGCEHGCIYCYAPEVTHSDWNGWRVVKIKANIAERLEKEIGFTEGVIGIGTVTDPYQYAEKRFGLTETCLKIIKNRDRPVHIHTKSDLIIRDVDLISSMKSTVGVTITGIDERISKMTEPGAPMPSKRLEALKVLTEAGIDTYALVGPILGHLEGAELEFVDAIRNTGVKRMYLDRLNIRPFLGSRLGRMHISGSMTALEKIRSEATASGIVVSDVFSR